MSICFPITNAIGLRIQRANLITYRPFPRGCGRKGSSYLQKHRYSTMLNKILMILTRWLWGKRGKRGGLVVLESFWRHKKALQLSIPFEQTPINILEPLVQYDPPCEKQKTNNEKKPEKQEQIKTHPWTFFSQKIQNSTFLEMGAWKLYNSILWYIACNGDFHYAPLAYRVFPPFFKIRQILSRS